MFEKAGEQVTSYEVRRRVETSWLFIDVVFRNQKNKTWEKLEDNQRHAAGHVSQQCSFGVRLATPIQRALSPDMHPAYV